MSERSFYSRYVELAAEKNLKPQSPEMVEATGVAPASITGWKQGSLPKPEALCNIADYFGVTVDYLLCRTDCRHGETLLTDEENIILEAYRTATTYGRFKIIQTCMNEKGKKANAG